MTEDELLAEIERLERENKDLSDQLSQEACYCRELDPRELPCDECLNRQRRERMGDGVHNTGCACNDCTWGEGGYPRGDY